MLHWGVGGLGTGRRSDTGRYFKGLYFMKTKRRGLLKNARKMLKMRIAHVCATREVGEDGTHKGI